MVDYSKKTMGGSILSNWVDNHVNDLKKNGITYGLVGAGLGANALRNKMMNNNNGFEPGNYTSAKPKLSNQDESMNGNPMMNMNFGKMGAGEEAGIAGEGAMGAEAATGAEAVAPELFDLLPLLFL